ncbi:MAG: carbon-nitrogen hydrolase family protein [Rhodocyclaceae bacterium]|nr:carbon-nitrogen hydrolase family protein [Rhodocyclaceae bacterium]MBX3670552.1 carbon-nitrogen hydrolase family protein [Rhodocyclaceae bacterium]
MSETGTTTRRGIRVAAVQMISGTDVAENLACAERLIAEAAADGAELVALPEYFALIHADESAKVRLREVPGGGPLQDFLSRTAQKYGVILVGGTIPLECGEDDKVFNTCLVFDRDGGQIARYDKIHLFGFVKGTENYQEARTIQPGREIVVFDCSVGRVGLGICYDIRFAELFRAMGEIDLIVVPAAFTETTGRAHWEVLLRARAIENQCYVLASAQGGKHASGRMTHGNSMFIDPWGAVLARLDKGSGVLANAVDLDYLNEIRQNLPALKHRVLR